MSFFNDLPVELQLHIMERMQPEDIVALVYINPQMERTIYALLKESSKVKNGDIKRLSPVDKFIINFRHAFNYYNDVFREQGMAFTITIKRQTVVIENDEEETEMSLPDQAIQMLLKRKEYKTHMDKVLHYCLLRHRPTRGAYLVRLKLVRPISVAESKDMTFDTSNGPKLRTHRPIIQNGAVIGVEMIFEKDNIISTVDDFYKFVNSDLCDFRMVYYTEETYDVVRLRPYAPAYGRDLDPPSAKK